MSDSLRQKIDLLLKAFEGDKESCSLEEFKKQFEDHDTLQKEERFEKVVGVVCKYLVSNQDTPGNPEDLDCSKLDLESLKGGEEMSLIADMIISHLNYHARGYQRSPFFAYAEREIINKIKGYVGYPDTAGGVFLPGGSYCTLIAMICARYHKFPESKATGVNSPIQVIASSSSQSSIEEGMVMLGVGTENVIRIDLHQTTPRELEELIQKNNVFMITSTFFNAGDGMIEYVDKFSKIIKKHKLWHHIDAAEGGTALISSTYRYLTDFFQDADSLTIDFHSSLNLNQQLLLVRQGSLLKDCSNILAPFQCSNRADGIKLWLCDKFENLDDKATQICDEIFYRPDSDSEASFN